MQLVKLFETYMKERSYLKNASPLSLKSNRISWLRFEKVMGDRQLDEVNKGFLRQFVLNLRELPISPTTCNITIREFNAFLGWLHENEYLDSRLKMSQLKVERKVMTDLSEVDVRKFLNWKPQTVFESRLSALIFLLVDTGVRIEEALTLKRSDINFDDLLIKVLGKGRKERILPISLELRKILWRYGKTHQYELFFATRRGGKLSYHNMLRELKNLAADLEIENARLGFHLFRYGFALNYVRQGGDPFRLQRVMGHSTITTTQGYVRLVTDDLRETHVKTSRLNRLG
jgi:integrase/recombinase XerD